MEQEDPGILQRIRSVVQNHSAELVVVTKTRSPLEIRPIYDAGQRAFGENRVQELLAKKDALPEDILWHLIGHLQRNKVKYIAPFVHTIHSVDSEVLLTEIQKQAAVYGRRIRILLQVRVAAEETKYGLEPDDFRQLVTDTDWHALDHLCVCGVMGMATYTDDMARIAADFRQIRALYEWAAAQGVFGPEFCEVSMGMSGDYEIALAEGATIVRVGSAIFG